MLQNNLSIPNLLKSIIYFFHPQSNLKYWKRKTLNSGKSYLSNLDDGNTSYFLEGINLNNIKSILEIGCNSGNRIIPYAQKYPNINFFGIDIDSEAILIGREYCNKNGISNVHLIIGNMNKSQEFSHFFPYGVDLVCSWATLIYLHPAYTSQFFENLNNLTKKYFLFVEIHSEIRINPLFLGYVLLGTRNIARNYHKCISKFAPQLEITSVTPVPKYIWSPGGRLAGSKVIGQVVNY